MNDSKIPVRYSRALFRSAVENKILDKVYQDMSFIQEVCRMDEFRQVLENPVIIPSKKKKIIFSILENNVEKLTCSLVDLLITNGRENYLPAVARVFRDDTLKYRGITATDLITAVRIEEKVKKQITDHVASVFKTKVEMKESIDSDIIGGFILKINDSYIDASVRNKLRKIKKGLAVRQHGRHE